MKKIQLFLVIALCFLGIYNQSVAQNTFPSSGAVGIGTTTPNASSILEIKSTTQGVLIPRMNKAQRDAIINPVNGLLIYQTNNSPGFYYYIGSAWKPLSTKGANTSLSNLASTAINASLKPEITNSLDIGNTDSAWRNLYLRGDVFIGGKHIVRSRDDVNDNIFIGDNTGLSITSGKENITIGNTSLTQDISGSYNIAIGKSALFFDTASNNIAIGSRALFNNFSGIQNIAVGYEALFANTSGINNSAFGFKSLRNNSGIGFAGIFNSAFGAGSMEANTTGSYNSAFGNGSLSSNISGLSNSGFGSNALGSNTSGSWNIAVGVNALSVNTAQDKNTAIGWSAGNGSQSAACTYLGYNAHANAVVSGSMALGINATVTASNQVRIGTSAITSIGGYVNWSNISDGRVKKNIKQNVPGLNFINKLNPVSYNLDLDVADKILQTPTLKDENGNAVKFSQEEIEARKQKEQIIYSGFIAQDVEKAAKQIGYDFSGVDATKNDKDLYGLRYAEFVVPLVKAVQELSAQNDELKQRIENLETIINNQESGTNKQLTQNLSSSVNLLNKGSLSQNKPNPFNHNTQISYTLPKSFSSAKIIITDNTGKVLKQIQISGSNGTVQIDATVFSSGIYYYSLYIDDNLIDSKQMVFSK